MELYNELQKYVPPSWATGALSYQPESYVQVTASHFLRTKLKHLPLASWLLIIVHAQAARMNPTYAPPIVGPKYLRLAIVC